MLARAIAALSVLSLLTLPALANTSDLSVDVQGNLQNGATVTIALSGSLPNTATFLALGANTGSTTIKLGPGPRGKIELGIAAPLAVTAFGVTDGNGNLTVSFAIPALGVSGVELSLFAQAASIAVEKGGGPPKITSCVSDVEPVTIS